MRTLALLGGCALVIGGCSGTPAGPTALQGTHQPVILASGSSDLAPLAVEAARLTADDFAARGWECRLAPVPGRTVCSRPTQSFPSVPPPDDRPRTVTLLAWQMRTCRHPAADSAGDLPWTTVLATGEPYIWRPVIGSYECLQSTGS